MLAGKAFKTELFAAGAAAIALVSSLWGNAKIADGDAAKPQNRVAANATRGRKQYAGYGVERTSQNADYRAPSRRIRNWNVVAQIFMKPAEDAPRPGHRSCQTSCGEYKPVRCTMPDASLHSRRVSTGRIVLTDTLCPFRRNDFASAD